MSNSTDPMIMSTANRSVRQTLYVSDLDGTLLNRNAELADGCRAGLQELLADGLLFTIATARSVFSMQQILRDLELPLPVISFNGAYLSDLKSGRHEMVNAIDREIGGEILNLLLEHNCVPFLSTHNGIEDLVYYGAIVNDGMKWYLEDRFFKKDTRWRKSDDLPGCLAEQLVCITMIARSDELLEIQQQILERYKGRVEVHFAENMYSPGWHWLTVHDYRATKGRGVELLRSRYGLDDHHLVVFGDHQNDLKMFQYADHAVAVENALDEVKACASEIIPSHEEGSVVKYIKEVESGMRNKG